MSGKAFWRAALSCELVQEKITDSAASIRAPGANIWRDDDYRVFIILILDALYIQTIQCNVHMCIVDQVQVTFQLGIGDIMINGRLGFVENCSLSPILPE